jgi:hypothetical protein
MAKEGQPDDSLNGGDTCKECSWYESDPAGKTLGHCNNGSILTSEIPPEYLLRGKNGCPYLGD